MGINKIEFGIYLGTTYSVIAKVDGSGTTIIPNKTDNKNFVNSAVYIKKNGTIFIGDKAKNKIATDPKNGYSEFKLRMGSDHVYEFEKSGLKMTPVELSAEILKNLRQTAYEKCQKDLKAAVITVPADFTTPQTKATKDAAELAGFEQVILLQEPKAATIAYGLDKLDKDEIWLVYDFDESTFDVSIIQKVNEEINIINNQGDTYLGGKLIDWDIVEKIFVPLIVDETGLSDFNRNNPKYLKGFAKLKRAAELAKTEISHYGRAEIEIENLIFMENGDVYDFEYDMEKEQLDEVMKPFVDRTVNHCKKALKDINLTIDNVTKIILVGSLALSPHIHERLTEEFDTPLEYSIDPTTVYARGAAIFANNKENQILKPYEKSQNKSEKILDDCHKEEEKEEKIKNNTNNKFKEQKDEADLILKYIESQISINKYDEPDNLKNYKELYEYAVDSENLELILNIKEKFEKIFFELERDEITKLIFFDLSLDGKFMDKEIADMLIKDGQNAILNESFRQLERIIILLYNLLDKNQMESESILYDKILEKMDRMQFR